MEPMFSKALAVCQSIDFTAELATGAWKIYNSEPSSDRMSYLRSITDDLVTLTKISGSPCNIQIYIHTPQWTK